MCVSISKNINNMEPFHNMLFILLTLNETLVHVLPVSLSFAIKWMAMHGLGNGVCVAARQLTGRK